MTYMSVAVVPVAAGAAHAATWSAAAATSLNVVSFPNPVPVTSAVVEAGTPYAVPLGALLGVIVSTLPKRSTVLPATSYRVEFSSPPNAMQSW